MKILYITANPLEYSSSANMRNVALIKGLIETGNEVSSLSLRQNNIKYIDQSMLDINLKHRYWVNDIVNEKNNINKKSNDWKNSIIVLIAKLYRKITIYDPKKVIINKSNYTIQIKEKFDLIISSSDPKTAHLIAEKLIRENKNICKKWIQYWGDPFLGDINKKTLIPNYFIKKEEKRLISLCDKVIYVSPFTLKKQKEIYCEHANKLDFLPVPFKNKINYNINKNSILTVGYFGNYYSQDRNIQNLYNAIVECDYKAVILGDSDIKIQPNNNITILKGRQNLDVVKQYEEQVDILICICNKKGTQIPGKIYHYSATNKPILVILDGPQKEELKQYFEKYKRFLICENSVESIKKTLTNIDVSKFNYDNFSDFDCKKIAKEFIKGIEI